MNNKSASDLSMKWTNRSSTPGLIKLQSAALVVNKTLRKGIYDQLVDREDFNDMDMIGNQRNATSRKDRQTPKIIYPYA